MNKLSYAGLMRNLLTELMSFRRLFNKSDYKRKERGRQEVRVRPMRVSSEEDQETWNFSYKSKPSTTAGRPENGLTTVGRHHGYIKFLKEDVSSKESAYDLDCMVHCSCFSPDALVLMEDGTYKPIKDIVIGDVVYTHVGRTQKVKNVMVREVRNDESVYNISVEGFPGVMTVTGDHPFYTLRGNDKCLCGCGKEIWKNVYSHKCSSPNLILNIKYIKHHHNRPIKIKDCSCGKFEWISIENFRDHEWFLSPWLNTKNKISNVPSIEFARLVGYYAAEGCIPKKGTSTRLTFNINEKDTLGSDVINICNILGYKTKIYNHPTCKCFNIEIQNKEFRNFCLKNVGKGSLNKKLSIEIMSWDDECLKNLLLGEFLGDGWIDPKKGMKCVSISFDLICQLSTILNKLKIRNTISVHQKNNRLSKNILYQVIVPRGESAESVRLWLTPYLRNKDIINSSQKNLHYKNHNRVEGQLRCIKKYEKVDYKGLVYDLTIENDESFIVNGIAVHNCPDYFYRWEYNNARADAGEFCDAHNLQAPKPQGPPHFGVGRLGTGLCKHLCALAEYLKTKIEPNAPEPEETPEPGPEPGPIKIKSKPYLGTTKIEEPPTINAPKPEDSYSDSRSGSDTLQEVNKSTLYERMSNFVRSNPQFDITYEEPLDETINEIIKESHDRGEWWIDEGGSTVFADGDVGDYNHEAIVIQSLAREILSHFGIEEEDPGTLDNYEESIKESLIADGRLDEEEIAGWDNMQSSKYRGPSDVITKKLLEDKVYDNEKQATQAVLIAYGSSRDARDYAMEYWRWKIMKTEGSDIEIQTWHLKPDDLGIIVRGIWEIMGEDNPDDPEDSDNVVGDDGYPGPRINVTVQASGKIFRDIPLAVLEKKMPQYLHNYQSGVHVGYTENLTESQHKCEKCWRIREIPSRSVPNAEIQVMGKWLCRGCYEDWLKQHPQAIQINEGYHHLHKEYRLYEGNRHIVVIFEDNTRLKFEVHFRNMHGEDRDKWRHKAFTKWKSLATKLHNDEQLDDAYNPIVKSWKECFKKALKDPEMKEYIRSKPHQRVFDNKDIAPTFDPINFTPR